QRKSGERLVSVLKRLGVLGEKDLLDFLSRKYGIPIVGLNALDVHADVVRLIKREIAHRYHVCPISRKRDTLTLALSDPTGPSSASSPSSWPMRSPSGRRTSISSRGRTPSTSGTGSTACSTT